MRLSYAITEILFYIKTWEMSFRDVSKTEELVELYEEEDLLWNTAHEHYYRKDKRKQALNRISAMLGIAATEVNKKITNLRTYYSKELNKIKRSRLKVPKGGELYVSKWEHFKSIDRFLYPYIQGRKHVELSDEDDLGDPDYLDDEEGSHGSQSMKQEHTEITVEEEDDSSLSCRKRKHQEEKSLDSPPNKSGRERLHRMCQKQPDAHNQIDNANGADIAKTSRNSSPSKTSQKAALEDREDVFGKHVANELRLIPNLRTRQLVKLKIQNILFEAQFGNQPEVCSNTSLCVDQTFSGLPSVDNRHGQTGLDNSHSDNVALHEVE